MIEPRDLKTLDKSGASGAHQLKHVAIIMDGNGRWANQRGFSRIIGHKHGVKNVRTVVKAAKSLGIEVLSLFAFSEENWGRPLLEVRSIMALIDQFIIRDRKTLDRENIRLKVIGDLTRLPLKTRALIENTVEILSKNSGMILNVAISYSGRADILNASLKLAEALKQGALSPENVTPEVFSKYLSTSDIAAPDLLIRTSGEHRISNFMIWQLAYTELYFTDVLWPDFSEQDFYAAIKDYHMRDRRFGLVKTQNPESLPL